MAANAPSDQYLCAFIFIILSFFIMIQLNSFYLKKRGTHQILSCVDEKTKIFKQDIVENKNLCFEGLSIDKYRRVVIHGETEIELTYTEFEILLLLAQNAGIVFSKEQIYDCVWKEPYFGDYNIVMSHIRNLREKIEDNPSKPMYIQTVWGVGYHFNKNLSSGL